MEYWLHVMEAKCVNCKIISNIKALICLTKTSVFVFRLAKVLAWIWSVRKCEIIYVHCQGRCQKWQRTTGLFGWDQVHFHLLGGFRAHNCRIIHQTNAKFYWNNYQLCQRISVMEHDPERFLVSGQFFLRKWLPGHIPHSQGNGKVKGENKPVLLLLASISEVNNFFLFVI